MKDNLKKQIIDEFDNKIGSRKGFSKLGRTPQSKLLAVDLYDEIIDFIRNLLKQERLRIIEEVISEIAQYSGINDKQTKALIKIIKND
jgi:hypothetical protein